MNAELLLILSICILIPVALTIINSCFWREESRLTLISFWATLIVGTVFYWLLYNVSFDEAGDWFEQIYNIEYHNSLYSGFRWCIAILMAPGVLALIILRHADIKKMPPLVPSMLLASVIIMNITHIAFAIQLAKNLQGIQWMLYVYHLNILLLTAGVMKKHITEMKKEAIRQKQEAENGRKTLNKIIIKLSQSSMWTFIFLFALVGLAEIIFIIVAQEPAAAIKAFTDTADWTFSQQIPPPPLDYEGHYLCTVAAGGHKKVVKPLRLGHRRGAVIVVNRQLCIANAFEDYIMEKMPHFHKWIRHVYDTYGYPISKHITTPLRADLVYCLMKPLEWFFLIFLYLFDRQPEKRIGRQYL